MSSKREMHVAVAQVHSGGTIAKNLTRMEKQIRAAAVVGAHMVLFCEGALQGYGYGSDFTANIVAKQAVCLDSEPCLHLSKLACQRELIVMAGFFEEEEGAYYNSCLVAWPDGKLEVQRKHSLTKNEVAAGISAGERRRQPFVINGIKCAIIICSDSGMNGLYTMLSEEGFDYRLCPTAGGGKMADMLHESALDTPEGAASYARERKRVFMQEPVVDLTENQGIGFASANALGPVGRETCHMGHCLIVDNRGVLRGQIPGTPVLEHQQDSLIHARLAFPAKD